MNNSDDGSDGDLSSSDTKTERNVNLSSDGPNDIGVTGARRRGIGILGH